MDTVTPSVRRRARIQDPIDETEALRGTPIVQVAYPSGAAFLDTWADEGEAGELAVVTRAQPRSGTHVVLEITWPELPNRVYLPARVFQRQLGLIARIHPDGAPARDFLLQMATGTRANVHLRRQERFCVRLPIRWRRFGAYSDAQGVAEDLSTGGMLIACRVPPPLPGERIALRMMASRGAQDLVLTGVVRHVDSRSRDLAFGVQLEPATTFEQRRLRRLVRTFAARGVVLLQPA